MRRSAALLLVLLFLPILIMPPAAHAGHSGVAVDALDRYSPAINGFGGSSYPNGASWDNNTGTSSVIQSSNARSGDGDCTTNAVKFSIGFRVHTAAENRAVQSISVEAKNTGSGGGTQACLRVYGIKPDGSSIDLGWMGSWPIGNPAPRHTYSLSFQNQDFTQLDFYLNQRVASPSANYGLEIFEITAPGIPNTPPPAVADLAATATGCAINIAWTPDPDAYTTGYKVYRATSSGGSYSLLTTIASRTAGGYTDTDVVTDDTRHYKVLAYSPDGDGPLTEPVSAQAGICDGSGLGSVGADSHMGPNELTHKAPKVSYTGFGQWTLASSTGVSPTYNSGCTSTGTLAEHPLACVTDGTPSTYAILHSIDVYNRDTSCYTSGYVTWDFEGQARPLKSFHVRAATFTMLNQAQHAGCIRVAYQGGDGTWYGEKTWTNLAHGVMTDLWHNASATRAAYAVRIYVGDTNCGGTSCKGGAVLSEADFFDANATEYHTTSSLRDLTARYSAKVTGSHSYGDYYTRPFTLFNGEWKVVMPVAYDSVTGRYQNWVFEATGQGFKATTDSIGPRVVSWEETDSTPDCAVGIYTLTLTGGSRTVTARAPGTNSGTVFCRITGSSFMPSPYQPANQGYKIQADWTARTCGAVSCTSTETAGMFYQNIGYPWLPMIDGDFTAENLKPDNFTIGSVLMGSGAPGTRAVLSLAKYPYQFFGNGLFVALAQLDGTGVDSTKFEILLNGRPASVVYNGATGGYEYAIFYLDDQASRRGVDNALGDKLQGNRREHGFIPETYEIEILKGFASDKPIRVVRSFGFEGHSGITCRDFCSGNVDLSFYKTPYENSNKITWTVTDANGTRLQGVRVTDNQTGTFSFTNAAGQVTLTDRYKDTRFTFALTGYYTKCVGFVYQSLDGQQVTTRALPCASSESYPEIRAQNLAYTLILYPVYQAPPSSTTFNEVPVDLVDAPVQGITFRSSNLTRLTPDAVSIQVQRNLSEDLIVTVMKFDPSTGTLSRASQPYVWPRTSTANPLLVVYPAGSASTTAHHGSYHLMVQKGSSYLTGVSFKISATWEAAGTIPVVTNPDQTGVGDGAARDNAKEVDAGKTETHEHALQDSLSKVDLAGVGSFAAIWIPVVLFLLLASLIARNWH